MMATEQLSDIRLANERMSIIDACNLLGMDIPDFSVKSMKVHCPFGQLYHPDEGHSRAFAIYPGTNSAYCFACALYFTPVKLIAMDKGISEDEAAATILEQTAYVAPDFEARWNAIATVNAVPSQDDLTEALKVACRRMVPDWEERQFEDEVATKLRKCLALLRKVHTEEDATRWLSVTKQVMRETMGVT